MFTWLNEMLWPETETFGFQSETRPRPSYTLPRPRRLKNMSRDRLKTETSRPRLQLCCREPWHCVWSVSMLPAGLRPAGATAVRCSIEALWMAACRCCSSSWASRWICSIVFGLFFSRRGTQLFCKYTQTTHRHAVQFTMHWVRSSSAKRKV